jgi:hypothetical protein
MVPLDSIIGFVTLLSTHCCPVDAAAVKAADLQVAEVTQASRQVEILDAAFASPSSTFQFAVTFHVG